MAKVEQYDRTSMAVHDVMCEYTECVVTVLEYSYVYLFNSFCFCFCFSDRYDHTFPLRYMIQYFLDPSIVEVMDRLADYGTRPSDDQGYIELVQLPPEFYVW